MTGWLGFTWLTIVAAIATWALAATLARPLIRLPENARLRPIARVRRVLLLAALPWLTPTIAALSILAIAAAKPAGLVADHCAYHGPGHPHLCLEHLPAVGVSTIQAAVVGCLLAAFVAGLMRLAVRSRRTSATIRSMQALCRGRGRLRLLDSDLCVALAIDRPGPSVVLSRGLLDRLAPRERRIVFGHEAAHLRHGDLRATRVVELLLLAHLPPVARRLRAAWHQALEERADDVVAGRYGAEPVARTLIKVLRAPQASPRPAFSAAGADVLRRIRRQLATGEVRQCAPVFELAYAVLLVAVAAAVLSAHHGIETLLGWLAGH